MEQPTPPQEGVSRKRPDVAARKVVAKNMDVRVVKLGIKGLLRPEYRDVLLPKLRERAIATGMAIRRASICLFYMILERLADPGSPDTGGVFEIFTSNPYGQKLLTQLVCNKKAPKVLKKEAYGLAPEIQALYEQPLVQELPMGQRYQGDTNSLIYAVHMLKTNLVNALWMNFEKRQTAFVRAWCKIRYLPRPMEFAIRRRVNGWTTTPEQDQMLAMHPAIQAFVDEQRALLRLADDKRVSKPWLKKNPVPLLRYYHRMLEFYHDIGYRRFQICPIGGIGARSFAIDTNVLYGVVKGSGLLFELMDGEEPTDAQVRNTPTLRQRLWNGIFNLPKALRGKIGKFTDMISTDGTSASVHFQVPKRPEADDDGSRLLKAPRCEDLVGKRIIAIDPGSIDLVHGVEKLDDATWKVWKLTKAQYYHEAGNTERNLKAAAWKKPLASAELDQSLAPWKIHRLEEWEAAAQAYIRWADELWAEMTKLRWARMAFDAYIRKRSAMDRFFHGMGDNVVVGYGAASFDPTVDHNLAAPTTSVVKACRRYHPVYMVDEYRTSMVCHCCHGLLHPVRERTKTKGSQEVRGLLWCSTSNKTIHCCKFVSRDFNAAINIHSCFVNIQRPAALSRPQPPAPRRPAAVIDAWMRL